MSQEDQAMSRAVEASLQDTYSDDIYEEPPIEDQVRRGHRYAKSLQGSQLGLTPYSPVALRFAPPGLAYGSILLQALVYIPQVRQRLMEYEFGPNFNPDDPQVFSDEYRT